MSDRFLHLYRRRMNGCLKFENRFSGMLPTMECLHPLKSVVLILRHVYFLVTFERCQTAEVVDTIKKCMWYRKNLAQTLTNIFNK